MPGSTTQKKQQVIFFGDSITNFGADQGGYIQLLESMSNRDGLGGKFAFSGSGINGNKVHDLFLRMDKDVLSKHPDRVFIYVGINDVWFKTLSGKGAEKFESVYLDIVKKLLERNIKTVLCTPAVIGERTDNTNPFDADMEKCCFIIRKIALNYHLQVVDLRKAFLAYNLKNNPSNRSKGLLTYDGIHLNDKGNQLVAEEMWKLIKTFK